MELDATPSGVPHVTRITEPQVSRTSSSIPAVEESESVDSRPPHRAEGASERPDPPADPEPYVGFGNVEARNGLQASVEIPLMLRLLDPPRGVRVLEVGCGRGVALPVLTHALAPRSITGLDVDASLLAVARERLQSSGVGARLVEGDVRAMPLDDASFDLVIDFGTCYHVAAGVDGSAAALREIARVLRPGGLLIHETPLAQHLAHPVRSLGRTLPWDAAPSLVRVRSALLWAMRRKVRS